MEFPRHCTVAVGELGVMFAEEISDGGFVIAEVAKSGGVCEGEFERFESVIEADDAQRATAVARGAEDGEDVRGRAEADVPDDKFAGVRGESLAEAQLFYIKRLGLSDGANDRVKRLAMSERMDAMNTVDEFDDLIIGSWRHSAF